MLQVVPEGIELVKLLGVQQRHQNMLSILYLTEGSSSRFLFPIKNPEREKMLMVQKLLFTVGK